MIFDAVALLLGLLCLIAARSEELSSASHKARGIELDQRGDPEGALQEFRSAVEKAHLDAQAWANFGVALMRQATRTGARSSMEEAIHAFERSLALNSKDEHTRANADALSENIDIMFPGMACPASVCRNRMLTQAQTELVDAEEYEYNDEMARLEEEATHMARIQAFDCSPERLTFAVTPKDRQLGVLVPSKLEMLEEALDECGVVVLDGAFDKDVVQILRESQAEAFATYQTQLGANATLENSTMAARRSEGRYELKAPTALPFTDPAFLRAPHVYPFLRTALGGHGRLELDTLSSITSVPGAPAQHWHQDAGQLFDYDWMPVSQPPHGLVVAVTLSDLPKKQGPTEFLVKSHRDCASGDKISVRVGTWRHRACPWVRDVFVAEAKQGAAVIFDLRITHRGGANASGTLRSIMYMTYVLEWWMDRVNFNDKQTRSFDELDGAEMKKLLSRLDSAAYTELLETRLAAAGVDVAGLQSEYGFQKDSFT